MSDTANRVTSADDPVTITSFQSRFGAIGFEYPSSVGARRFIGFFMLSSCFLTVFFGRMQSPFPMGAAFQKVIICQKNSPEHSMILLHGDIPDARMHRAWAIYVSAVSVPVDTFRA